MVQKSTFGIVVHGGAGSVRPVPRGAHSLRKEKLQKSVSAGYRILQSGGSSLDAVEEAIVVLEDSGVFNAGSGACLTVRGEIEPDAAVMRGDQSCGAVANASVVKNPVSLARCVMEKSDHVLIAGKRELEEFASAVGFPLFELKPSTSRRGDLDRGLARLRKFAKIDEWPLNSKLMNNHYAKELGTVGAVAIDSEGELCSGVSTGGRFMKLPGRVGDSAIVGAGLYADNSAGAACATGAGEDIIKVCLCKTACDFMKQGLRAQDASDAAISLISRMRGFRTAGLIAIDKMGQLGISRNTDMMPYSFQFALMKRVEIGGFFPTHEKESPSHRRPRQFSL